VIAAGSTNAIQNKLNINIGGTTIYTAQIDVEMPLPDYEIVYIYMNDNISKNWFSWIIPTKHGFARVGFGTTDGKIYFKT